MARRKKSVQEQAPIPAAVEPQPELASSHVVSAPAPSARPQDQEVGEGMSRADKIAAVINTVMTMDDAKVNEVLASIAHPAPEQTEADAEDAPEVVADEAPVANHVSVMAKEAVDVIFAGEELSETVKNRASALWEAAIAAKLNELEADLNKELSEDFNTQFENEVAALTESMDSYLTDAVKEYVAENSLAIENGIKADLYENMITDMSNVLRSYNFAINDEQIELVQEAYAEKDQAVAELNEQMKKNMSQRELINELEKALVFEAVASDLPLMQREKLKSLAENVDAADAVALTDKLTALKERFVVESYNTAAQLKDIASSNAFYISEEVEVEDNNKYTDGNVKKYVEAVSNHVRR